MLTKVMQALIRDPSAYSSSEIEVLAQWVANRFYEAYVADIVGGHALIDVLGHFIIVYQSSGGNRIMLPPFSGFYLWCELPRREWFCQLTPLTRYGPFNTLTHVEAFIQTYDIRRN